MTLQELKEYEKEIYGEKGRYWSDKDFSINELIESHRHLRSLNLDNQKQFNKRVNEGYAIGRKQGFEHVVSGGYISKETLKGMSLVEFANLISDFVVD